MYAAMLAGLRVGALHRTGIMRRVERIRTLQYGCWLGWVGLFNRGESGLYDGVFFFVSFLLSVGRPCWEMGQDRWYVCLAMVGVLIPQLQFAESWQPNIPSL
jgi:hypothetical protein